MSNSTNPLNEPKRVFIAEYLPTNPNDSGLFIGVTLHHVASIEAFLLAYGIDPDLIGRVYYTHEFLDCDVLRLKLHEQTPYKLFKSIIILCDNDTQLVANRVTPLYLQDYDTAINIAIAHTAPTESYDLAVQRKPIKGVAKPFKPAFNGVNHE